VERAAGLLNPHRVGDRLFGNVASVVISEGGNLYGGVCIDTGSGTGFCAEHAAIASMVTAGEYRIKRVVAVWRADDGELFVLPPCGRCREFIKQIDPTNLDAQIILGLERRIALRELLPRTEWPDPY
jgi:cytidine deaminase